MRTRILAVVGLLVASLGPVGLPTSGASAGVATTPVVWLCKPGLPADPCEIPLDTTHYAADGSSRVETPVRKPSAQRPVDCFYVYPTVSNQLGVNATKAKDPEILSIAKYQAARFSSQCRMFAPVYRQAPLSGIPTVPLAVTTAYADVRQAWREYLANDNAGRGFVLIGHSQGTLMLRKLIHEEIDANPELRKRLVGALLMGGNTTVKAGQVAGGDFANVPLCTAKGQSGCAVAYSTYSKEGLLPFFGNSLLDVLSPAMGLRSGLGYAVACTDPGPLSGMTGPVGVTVPTEPFAKGPIQLGITVTSGGAIPQAPTTWVQPADRVQGSCRAAGGARVYRYDSLPGSRRLHEFPPTWGTHLVDVNLGLERLVRIVELQTASWLAARASAGPSPRAAQATPSPSVPQSLPAVLAAALAALAPSPDRLLAWVTTSAALR